MTNQTLLVSLLIGSTLALALGLVGRRFKHPHIASTFAFSVGVILGLPVMFGYWQELQRLIQPREAVEWIPLGLLGIAIVTSIWCLDSKRAKWWIGLGGILAVLTVMRMMYGSIYLRSGSLFTLSALLIAGWGLVAGFVWVAQLIPIESRRRLDGVLQCIGLLAVSANLGMSGSFTYAAVGILCLAIAITSWLAGQTMPSLVSVASLLILGLGPTFSETQWLVAVLLGLMVVLFACLPRLQADRLRWGILLAATLCLTIGTGVTIVKLREDISGKSNEASGYEAYR